MIHKPELLLAVLTAVAPLAAQRIQLPAKLSELETRARQDSNDAAAQYNVALAYWNEKRWDDADSALHRAVRIEPQFAAPYLALWALPYARRPQLWDEVHETRVPAEWRTRIEEADRMYRHAFLLDPLVDLRIVSLVLPPRSVFVDLIADYDDFYQWYDDSFEKLRQGNFDDAYQRFQRMMLEMNADRHPDRVPTFIYWWHGLAAAHVNKNDEAVFDFRQILNRYLATERRRRDSITAVPLRTNEYRYELAVMKQRAGQLDEAIQLYQEALENDAGLYPAHARLASIYETRNLWVQAVAERRAAVNANPDDASLLMDLGLTLAKARNLGEAEQALHQAMDANPRDARVPYYLGRVEEQLNKPADARTAYTRFLSLAPSRYATQIADAKQRLETLH
ncbi:MAG: hypothetical protein AUJ00_03600 [Gemmatimonadetes bacterium 13_1_40CM_3_70_6]|nr:MAG: hypothetical protein AUJ00_03600 [Gemmatimonadetes bacterium 13_1_40CM_3_70_6]